MHGVWRILVLMAGGLKSPQLLPGRVGQVPKYLGDTAVVLIVGGFTPRLDPFVFEVCVVGGRLCYVSPPDNKSL